MIHHRCTDPAIESRFWLKKYCEGCIVADRQRLASFDTEVTLEDGTSIAACCVCGPLLVAQICDEPHDAT